jgi:hypothetical protein
MKTKTYKAPTPHPALGIVAVVAAAFAFGLLVVAPAGVGSTAMPASDPTASPLGSVDATRVAINPARVDVVAMRDGRTPVAISPAYIEVVAKRDGELASATARTARVSRKQTS